MSVSRLFCSEQWNGWRWGRTPPLVHLLRSVQFRPQQPVLRGPGWLRSWSWALGCWLGRGLCGPLWLCGGRGRASLQLGLELGKLLGTGQCLQQIVLLLQLGIFLYEFLDLFLEDLHFLSNCIHQMAFHQIHSLLDFVVNSYHTCTRWAIVKSHRGVFGPEQRWQERNWKMSQLVNS